MIRWINRIQTNEDKDEIGALLYSYFADEGI